MESFIGRPMAPLPCRQLAVLVLDSRSSMTGARAEEAAATVAELIDQVRVTSRAATMSVAGVTFAAGATDRWGPVPAAEADGSTHRRPVAESGTSIAAGLTEAERQIRRFLAMDPRGLPSSIVVVLLSDGECGTPDETRRVADRLRADPRVKLATMLFPGNGAALLEEISSQPHYAWSTRGTDPESRLRFVRAALAAATGSAAPALT